MKKGRSRVKATFVWFVGTGLFGLSILIPPAQSAEDAAPAQKNKPVVINRLYTGPDGQTQSRPNFHHVAKLASIR
jgi:hypothetical protein